MSILRLVVCGLSILSAAVHGEADDIAPKRPNPDIERITCRVRVADSLGNPVQGASVVPSGFRTLAHPKGFCDWVTERFGPQPHAKTNGDGIAEIQLPKFSSEKLEIGTVIWLVDSPNYVVYRKDHNIKDAPAEVSLKDGYRIAATAVTAETGEPIKKHLYAVQSGDRESLGHEWQLSNRGVLLSRVYDDAETSLRLVVLRPGAPARYSDLITVNRGENNSRVFLRDIPLRTGTRVEGKLEAAVPRPVVDGIVSAFIANPANPESNDRSKLWTWFDKADIQPDGSFVFESLPQGDVVQFVALCDGWISKTPTADEIDKVVPWDHKPRRDKNQVLPQVFALDRTTIESTIKMERSATCRVIVVDSRGERLANANVKMWPRRHLLRTGGVNLNYNYRSIDMLRAFRQGATWNWESIWSRNDFHAKTNADGVAVIRNLPGNRSIALTVTHAEFDQPVEGGSRFTNVDLKSGATTTATMKMEPKGKNVLGGP